MSKRKIDSKFNQAQCRHLVGQIVTSAASPQTKAEILKEAFAWGSDPMDTDFKFPEGKPNPKSQSYWHGVYARLNKGQQLRRRDREELRRVVKMPINTITTGHEHKALLKRFGFLSRNLNKNLEAPTDA